MKKILLALLLFVGASESFAQNYYVCEWGDDANNGSQFAPFKSFPKGIRSFNAGDAGSSLLFCRGGSFPTSDTYLEIFNPRCSTSNICTIGDYGDANKARPRLVANATEAGLFFSDGGYVADGGYLIKNLSLTSNDTSKFGIKLANKVTDVVMDNLDIQHFSKAVILIHGSQITLKNSQITNNSGQGWLGGGRDVLIENNHFENNGSDPVFDHNIYLNSPSHTSVVTGMTVRGNTLYKSNIVGGKCSGVSMVAHGLINDLTIENNIIKEDVGTASGNCWGISVDPGYPEEEVFNNVIIRNNTIENMGGVALGCASCVGALIENNTIIGSSDELFYGIEVPAGGEDSIKSHDVTINNNSITITGSGDLVNAGIRIAGSATYIVTNNTVIGATCIERSGANSSTDISTNICDGSTVPPIDPPIDPDPPIEPPVDLPVCVSSKQQMEGLIQRTQNIIDREFDAKGSNNTINNIYDDKVDLQIRIDSMNDFIDGECQL